MNDEIIEKLTSHIPFDSKERVLYNGQSFMWSIWMILSKSQFSPRARVFISRFFYVSTALCLLAGLYWGFQLILYPYQHEAREGAPLVIVQNLLRGINPYSLDVQPQNTYVYGVLYPLLSTPLNALLGIDIINMRIMNLILITLTAFLLYTASYRENRNPLFSFILSATFFLGMFLKTFHARPEALGVLLLMTTVIVAHKYNYSRRALAVSVLLSVLAFFTKPYYIIGIGYISVYLFFIFSPKKSLMFFTCFLGTLCVSLTAAHLLWPAYINNNFLHHTGVASYSLPVLRIQLIYFFKKEFLSIPLYLIFLGSSIVINIKRESPFSRLVSSLNIYDLAVFFAFIVFVLKLGGHTGSYGGVYLHHLMYPFLLLSIGTKYKNILPPKYIYGFILPLFLVACGSYVGDIYRTACLLPAYKVKIKNIEKYFQTGKSILTSADTASLAIKYKIPINDSGQSEYYTSGSPRGVRLIYGNSIMNSYRAYENRVHQNIVQKDYDYVLKSWVNNYALPQDFTNYYRLEISLSYPGIMNPENTKVEIWVPIS